MLGVAGEVGPPPPCGLLPRSARRALGGGRQRKRPACLRRRGILAPTSLRAVASLCSASPWGGAVRENAPPASGGGVYWPPPPCGLLPRFARRALEGGPSEKTPRLPQAAGLIFFLSRSSELGGRAKKYPALLCRAFSLGGRWGSNPRPLVPQTSALTS